jgi:hypothetical protein
MKLSILGLWQTVAALLLFSTAPQSFSQTKADFDAVAKFSEKFKEHQKDFNDFAAAVGPLRDWQLIHCFVDIAGQRSIDCVSVCDLIAIIGLISDEPTKVKVQQQVMAFRFSDFLKNIKKDLEKINTLLPNTQNTATVVQANKLKDDIKEFQAKLQELLAALPKQTQTAIPDPSK